MASGLSGISANVERFNEELKRGFTGSYAQIGQTVSRAYKERVHVRTGMTRASIGYKVDPYHTSPRSVDVGSSLPWAKWLEKGTKPHVIRVRNKRILAINVKELHPASYRNAVIDKFRLRARMFYGWTARQAQRRIPNKRGFIIIGLKVDHPGTHGDDALSRAVEATKQDVLKHMKSGGMKAFSSVLVTE